MGAARPAPITPEARKLALNQASALGAFAAGVRGHHPYLHQELQERSWRMSKALTGIHAEDRVTDAAELAEMIKSNNKFIEKNIGTINKYGPYYS